jgi:hypothetical protein
MQEIIDLEIKGWEALSIEGDAAYKFYESVLLDNAIMLFPGGMKIHGKMNILRSFGSQPWKSFQIEEPQVTALADGLAVLTYVVTARREGGDLYHVLISSLYILVEGTWKLGHHQHSVF